MRLNKDKLNIALQGDHPEDHPEDGGRGVVPLLRVHPDVPGRRPYHST